MFDLLLDLPATYARSILPSLVRRVLQIPLIGIYESR
jgi:hypothetical protein